MGGGQRGEGGVYGKISHYFYINSSLFLQFQQSAEHWGRFEGRESGGPPLEQF